MELSPGLHIPDRSFHHTKRITLRAVGEVGTEDRPVEQRPFVVVVAIDGRGSVEHHEEIKSVAYGGRAKLRERMALQRRKRHKSGTRGQPVCLDTLGPGEDGFPVAIGPFELAIQEPCRFQIKPERPSACARSAPGRRLFRLLWTDKPSLFLREYVPELFGRKTLASGAAGGQQDGENSNESCRGHGRLSPTVT